MFYSYFFFTFCLFFCILWQIGAVNGSEEFKLGVTMNADMKGITYASVIYSDVRTILAMSTRLSVKVLDN